MKLDYRINAPASYDRTYLPYEEQMELDFATKKKEAAERIRGFYWEDGVADEALEKAINACTTPEEVMTVLQAQRLPDDSTLPEGHYYEALNIEVLLGFDVPVPEGYQSTGTSITVRHRLEKSMTRKERT